jgi:hypothetical protein
MESHKTVDERIKQILQLINIISEESAGNPQSAIIQACFSSVYYALHAVDTIIAKTPVPLITNPIVLALLDRRQTQVRERVPERVLERVPEVIKEQEEATLICEELIIPEQPKINKNILETMFPNQAFTSNKYSPKEIFDYMKTKISLKNKVDILNIMAYLLGCYEFKLMKVNSDAHSLDILREATADENLAKYRFSYRGVNYTLTNGNSRGGKKIFLENELWGDIENSDFSHQELISFINLFVASVSGKLSNTSPKK